MNDIVNSKTTVAPAAQQQPMSEDDFRKGLKTSEIADLIKAGDILNNRVDKDDQKDLEKSFEELRKIENLSVGQRKALKKVSQPH